MERLQSLILKPEIEFMLGNSNLSYISDIQILYTFMLIFFRIPFLFTFGFGSVKFEYSISVFIMSKNNHHRITPANIILLSHADGLNIRLQLP